MSIFLSVLEHSHVPIEIREILSFTQTVTKMLTAKIAEMPDVEGAVLLSTCNRTELYLTGKNALNPGEILCKAAEVSYAPFAEAFEQFADEAAVRHLMEVASGLRSRIFGEDQIISQVKSAIAIAREVHSACHELETLFRIAISAGKEVRSSVRFTSVPTSAASRAVELIEGYLKVSGLSAMVIGNGEMGRLAASLLESRGCNVTITLRTYKHGETIVPPGCSVVPYEERFSHMDGMDFVISATTSPHYTVGEKEVSSMKCPPKYFIDLSIPRDIQPSVGDIDGVTAFNVDDLEDCAPHLEPPPLVYEILQKHEDRFYRWLGYKECMPAVEELKQAILDRLMTAKELEDGLDTEQILELAVERTVDLVAGGFAGHLTSESMQLCSEKIRANTTARKVI